MCPV
jgi:nitrate reductase alpha subunit